MKKTETAEINLWTPYKITLLRFPLYTKHISQLYMERRVECVKFDYSWITICLSKCLVYCCFYTHRRLLEIYDWWMFYSILSNCVIGVGINMIALYLLSFWQNSECLCLWITRCEMVYPGAKLDLCLLNGSPTVLFHRLTQK